MVTFCGNIFGRKSFDANITNIPDVKFGMKGNSLFEPIKSTITNRVKIHAQFDFDFAIEGLPDQIRKVSMFF